MSINFASTFRLLAIVGFLVSGSFAQADIIFDSIPSPEPFNLPSLGYQATSTAEFGDHIALAGTKRSLTDVTIGMSNWAVKSTYLDGNDVPLAGYGHVTMDGSGYEHDLTLNLYSVDNSGSNPGVGSLIATKTVTAFVPWRPETNGPGTAWEPVPGTTYNGIFFTVDFDFSTDGITLPNEVIAAVAYDTQTHGYTPIGAAGPYNSLNFALASNPAEPNVGTNVELDAAFWNTSFAGFYADGGADGVGILRRDTDWSPYTGAIEINAVPEPSTIALLGIAGVAGLAMVRRRQG